MKLLVLFLLSCSIVSGQIPDSLLIFDHQNIDTSQLSQNLREEIKYNTKWMESTPYKPGKVEGIYFVKYNEKLLLESPSYFFIPLTPDSILETGMLNFGFENYNNYNWSGNARPIAPPQPFMNLFQFTRYKDGILFIYETNDSKSHFYRGLFKLKDDIYYYFYCEKITPVAENFICMNETSITEIFESVITGAKYNIYNKDITYCNPYRTVLGMQIFDFSGRVVKSLIEPASYPQGNYTFPSPYVNLSPGLYLFRLQVDDKVYTKKIMVTSWGY